MQVNVETYAAMTEAERKREIAWMRRSLPMLQAHLAAALRADRISRRRATRAGQ